MVFFWGYFIYTGSVSTIWPLFGTANQLLATIALAVGTSYIINRGKLKYAWITIAPMLFVGVTTVYAAVLNILNIYLPQTLHADTFTQGMINLALSVVILGCSLVVFYNAVPQWFSAYTQPVVPVSIPVEE